jgi:hypothetical protein
MKLMNDLSSVQRVAEEVRAKYPQVNKLISMTKSVSESPTSNVILQVALARHTLALPTSANKMGNLDRSSQLLQ